MFVQNHLSNFCAAVTAELRGLYLGDVCERL